MSASLSKLTLIRTTPTANTRGWSRDTVRAVKEMDSKSIGLCPQGFQFPRCRFASTKPTCPSASLESPAQPHFVAMCHCCVNPLEREVSWSSGNKVRVHLQRQRQHIAHHFWAHNQKMEKYTQPGSNWRPSACSADVIATRPWVLALEPLLLETWGPEMLSP